MIIPAILENSTAEVQNKINLVKGLVDRVQIDVVDGIFADNLTVSPVDLLNIDFAGMAVDIHLMTDEPVDFLEKVSKIRSLLANGQGDSCIRAIGQVERMGNQAEFIATAEKFKMAVGLGFDLYTRVDAIDQKIAANLDCVLLMAVKAGTQGERKFSPAVIEKIREIKSGVSWQSQETPVKIIIDGGLNPENIKICKQAGAGEFAVGSFLWQHKDIKQAFNELNEIIQ